MAKEERDNGRIRREPGVYSAGEVTALLGACRFREEEVDLVRARILSMRPDQKFRTLIVSNNDQMIRRLYGEEEAARFLEYEARVDMTHLFGWVTAQTFYLVNAYTSTLVRPEMPFHDGLRAAALAWFRNVDRNPFFGLVKAGMAGSVLDLFSLLVEQTSQMLNFGRLRSELRGPRRLRVHFEQCIADYFMAQGEGLIDGIEAARGVELERSRAYDADLDEGYVEVAW